MNNIRDVQCASHYLAFFLIFDWRKLAYRLTYQVSPYNDASLLKGVTEIVLLKER